jgi:hypothetical protein
MTLSTDDDLPQFHRTVRMPALLWQWVKERAAAEDKTLHELVHNALDEELATLIDLLRAMGLVGEDGREGDKLVRVPMDDNVVGKLNLGRRRTGIPAVQLLLIALARHAGNRRPHPLEQVG